MLASKNIRRGDISDFFSFIGLLLLLFLLAVFGSKDFREWLKDIFVSDITHGTIEGFVTKTESQTDGKFVVYFEGGRSKIFREVPVKPINPGDYCIIEYKSDKVAKVTVKEPKKVPELE